MWGGRFSVPPAEAFRALNDSLPVDWRLVEEDIEGSVAWAGALGKAGVLTPDEVASIRDGLVSVLEEARSLPSPPVESGAEDVHTWVEQQLVARVGDLGKKLHTGRSRNDQVATDFRLWTKRAIEARLAELATVRTRLINLAERYAADPMPSYTHLQRAQPVTIGHWCLAYEAMLSRDSDRLFDVYDRVDACPLGSAALAGTAFAIDRRELAHDLGFGRACANSLDAVSDRDFVIEALSALSLCGVHLSRLGEELVVFASAEFGFVRMGDDVCSGSSLMPQKKNPDAMELLRGKAGGLLGALVQVSVAVKGLTLAYNKDLQEDKAPLFRAMDEASVCLRLLDVALDGIAFETERTGEAAALGGSLATELADHLVEQGIPFREAHGVVGAVVNAAAEQGVEIQDLSTDEIRAIEPRVGDDVREWLTVANALGRRAALGGTSPERVREAVRAARARLADEGVGA
ncbi:MAG: argininosuccinate lyase [Planctomycetota bacterium]